MDEACSDSGSRTEWRKIKIHKTAICGTDVHIYQWNDWAQYTIPDRPIAGREMLERS